MKRYLIRAQGGRVVSFDEVAEERHPYAWDDDGQIVFLDMHGKEVARFPKSHFESAHAALSWILFLCQMPWFTLLHVRLFLWAIGVGLPTIEGVCDPARAACAPPPSETKVKRSAE